MMRSKTPELVEVVDVDITEQGHGGFGSIGH